MSIKLCHDCTRGIVYDDWSHLDDETTNASVEAFLESQPPLGYPLRCKKAEVIRCPCCGYDEMAAYSLKPV